MERYPIEPEDLMPDEAHQVEVHYQEPQEFDTFEKKGKKHKHHGGESRKESTEGWRSVVTRAAIEEHERGEAAGLTYPPSSEGYIARAIEDREAIERDLEQRY